MDANLTVNAGSAMKWRRGLVLAGVHFVLAVPLVVSIVIPRYSSEKMHSQNSHFSLRLTAYQEEGQTVGFVPSCEEWRSQAWQEKILVSSELPAAVLSGWNSGCPAGWTFAGMIGIDIQHHTREKELISSTAFCLLIAFQWLMLGASPLVQPQRWWLEPGACNTVSTLIVVLLLAIGEALAAIGIGVGLVAAGIIAFLLLLLILFTWLVWLALLLWKTIKAAWKLATSTRRTPEDHAIEQ